jgi:hypothetical protein
MRMMIPPIETKRTPIAIEIKYLGREELALVKALSFVSGGVSSLPQV